MNTFPINEQQHDRSTGKDNKAEQTGEAASKAKQLQQKQ
jgi:hypothetical protein